MPFSCRNSSVRRSAAQWNLEALVATPGRDLIPCFFSALSTYGTFQAPATDDGEKLLARLAAVIGPPSTEPQVVKGGACGGEEEDSEFPFVGAMLSATWDFPAGGKDAFIAGVTRFLGPCAEAPE